MSNEKTAEEKEMKNIPERLFLVMDGSEGVEDFNDLDHEYVCWSQNRTGEEDIEYIRISSQFQQPAPDRIDKLLKLQIDECSNHIQRCARDKGQASYEMEEWIKSTPLIDYHKQPAPDNFAHVSEHKSGEEWLRQPHLKDIEQPAPQEKGVSEDVAINEAVRFYLQDVGSVDRIEVIEHDYRNGIIKGLEIANHRIAELEREKEKYSDNPKLGPPKIDFEDIIMPEPVCKYCEKLIKQAVMTCGPMGYRAKCEKHREHFQS